MKVDIMKYNDNIVRVIVSNRGTLRTAKRIFTMKVIVLDGDNG